MADQADRLDALRSWIESNPDIAGGDPVVRGTRVSVAMLSDLLRQGASEQELLEDYPSLTSDSLRAALALGATNAGPPSRHPSRLPSGPPTRIPK